MTVAMAWPAASVASLLVSRRTSGSAARGGLLQPAARIPLRPFSNMSKLALPASASIGRQRAALVPAAQGSGKGGGSSRDPRQQEQQQLPPSQSSSSLVGSAGLWLLWAALAGYAFFVAPNQTPLRDQYFLEKLVGLGADDGVTINAVFTQLFLIMGVWPLIYTALLIPSGRSGSGVPAWPFVTASYAVGAFGLLPFMALWQPSSPQPQVPAPKEQLQGFGNLMQKGFETPIPALLALAGAFYCIFNAATAGGAAWAEYARLLEESRFVHVTSLDFLTLTALAPFWMSNDAELRRWGPREKLVPVLSLIPVLGPAIYLCLRPRAQL